MWAAISVVSIGNVSLLKTLGVGWRCGAYDGYYCYNRCVCVVVWLQVQLYFMILERLGKCEEALEVIRGPLGGRRLCFYVCVFVCERVCVSVCECVSLWVHYNRV